MLVRPAALLAIGLSLLASCAGAPGVRQAMSDESERRQLLKITKSENANYVVYDQILDAAGRLARVPLDVYWVMGAEDGQREELNGYEQDIYGATIEEVDREAGRMVFAINAVKSKKLEAGVADALAESEVFTTIEGERARVIGIHLVVRPTWNPLRPDVEIHMAGAPDGAGASDSVAEIIR